MITNIGNAKNTASLWPWISFDNLADNNMELEKACGIIGLKRLYKKGDLITAIGENVLGVYFLQKGVAISTIVGENGLEKVVFINKAPCFFNESPFIGELGTEMEIRALTDCVITIIDWNDMNKLVLNNKLLNELFIKYIARKSYALIDQMIDILTLNPTKRIFKVLLYLAQAQETNANHNEQITIKLSQEELAKICGLHRVTVARAFKKLKNIGVIKNTSRSTIVLDSDWNFVSFDDL